MEHSLRGSIGDSGAAPVPNEDVVRFTLHLMAVRSAVRMGIMLNEQFPDEESFMAFLNAPDTVEGLTAFAEARDDIALLAMREDEAALAQAIRQHHPRALESVELLAEQIGVVPEDVVSFLLRA